MMFEYEKFNLFLECVVIFLLLTNAVSILTAVIAIRIVQLDVRGIVRRRFGEVVGTARRVG